MIVIYIVCFAMMCLRHPQLKVVTNLASYFLLLCYVIVKIMRLESDCKVANNNNDL